MIFSLFIRQVRHPNVIQYMGLSSSSTYNICILMEYMVNGSLYEQIHDSSVELSESLLHKIFVDCVKGYKNSSLFCYSNFFVKDWDIYTVVNQLLFTVI